MNLRILNETATTVTIGWDPVAAAGFDFLVDGVRKSYTHDGTRTSVKFGKPDAAAHKYGVKSWAFGDSGELTIPAPAPPPPPPPPSTGTEGRVRFCPFTNRDYLPYTDSPDAAQQSWMRADWQRAIVYTPYWDTRLVWFPNGWVYKDAYDGRGVIAAHPDWILKDSAGNNLYIPWGSLPYQQPAADFGNQPYRDYWIAQAKATVAKGYRGIHVDDVDMDINTATQAGAVTPPKDPRTGATMADAGWKRYFAEFLEQLRVALPRPVEISHNALWWIGSDGADQYVQRQIKAADYFTFERGFNDGNYTPAILVRLFDFIDKIHSWDVGANHMAYGTTAQEGLFNIACALLCSNGNDYLYGYGWQPDRWFAPNDVDLGAAKGPRYQNTAMRTDTWARDFTGGHVTADLAAKTGAVNAG